MLNIEAIPAFRDNYLWLLYDGDERAAWIVDPGAAAPVLQILAERNLPLAGILVTHQHPDHIGGLARLREHCAVPVYGPADTPAQGIDRPLREGDRVRAAGCEFEVLAVPGHTLDHIAYFAAAPAGRAAPVLFCGDTLFAGGCGRVFEGTFAMMHASLRKLARLPVATQVFCAHEYTLSNLQFALAVEPDNRQLQHRRDAAQLKRERGQATVPSTLADELATNPFLRCAEPAIRSAAAQFARQAPASDAETFAVLRGWKDNF